MKDPTTAAFEAVTAPIDSYRQHIYFEGDARARLTNAIAKISKAVCTTLGPHGQNAILDRPGCPTVTKDGVTVLYDLDFIDQVDNVMYETTRSAAEIVSKQAGDGTTSVVLLTSELMRLGNKYLTSGINPREFEKGIRDTAALVRDILAENATEAKTESNLKAALNTAANGETEVIDTLAEVFLEVGNDGMIFVRNPQGSNTSVVYEEGFVVPTTPGTPELLPADGYLEWDQAYCLVCRDKISKAENLVTILEDIMNRGVTKRLVIAVSEISEDALDLIHANNKSDQVELEIIVFRMPLYSERQVAYLEDLAALTDATMVDIRLGWKFDNIGIEQLGIAKNVNVGYYMVRFLGGRGQETLTPEGITRLAARLKDVREDRDTFSGNIDERTRVNERLAKLSGSIVSICPGAKTEPEMKRKRGVYEDAIMAGQAAIRGGILPGGGWALYHAATQIEEAIKDEPHSDYKLGQLCMAQAAKSIFKKISEDSGIMYFKAEREILSKNAPWTTSYNMKSMECGPMVETKVVDTFETLDLIIEQSVSTAATMMTVGAVIVSKPTESYFRWKEQQRMDHLRA